MAVAPFLLDTRTISLKMIGDTVEKAKQWQPTSKTATSPQLDRMMQEAANQQALMQGRAHAQQDLARMMSRAQEKAFLDTMTPIGIGEQSIRIGPGQSGLSTGSSPSFPPGGFQNHESPQCATQAAYAAAREHGMYGGVWDNRVQDGPRHGLGTPGPAIRHEQQRLSISELLSPEGSPRLHDPIAYARSGKD